MGLDLPQSLDFDRYLEITLQMLQSSMPEKRLAIKSLFPKHFVFGEVDEAPFPTIDERGILYRRSDNDMFAQWAYPQDHPGPQHRQRPDDGLGGFTAIVLPGS